MPFEITLDWRSLRSIGASANLCLADPLAAWHTSTQTSPCDAHLRDGRRPCRRRRTQSRERCVSCMGGVCCGKACWWGGDGEHHVSCADVRREEQAPHTRAQMRGEQMMVMCGCGWSVETCVVSEDKHLVLGFMSRHKCCLGSLAAMRLAG